MNSILRETGDWASSTGSGAESDTSGDGVRQVFTMLTSCWVYRQERSSPSGADEVTIDIFHFSEKQLPATL